MAKARAQLTLFPDLPKSRKPRAGSRLFFALWPDRGTRGALAAAAALIPPGASRLRRVRPERYHMTLCFFGSLNPQQVEAAKKAGSTVAANAFELALDTLGHFPQVRVGWIGPRSLPGDLARLKANLDRELLIYGLPVETEAFRPHVTCVRGLCDAPAGPAPDIRWPVKEFVLVRSRIKRGSSTYQLLARWPLKPVGGGSLPGSPANFPEEPVIGPIADIVKNTSAPRG